jgi:virginiamycin B lyase
MRAKSGVISVAVCCLAVTTVACGDNQESADPQAAQGNSGVVIAAVTAPPNAKCIVVTAKTATTTVTSSFNVAAEKSTTFNLSGLPEGNVTFSAQAYNVACSGISGVMATYVSDAVTMAVTAAPATLTLQMRPASGATGTVSVNFPNPPGTAAQYTIQASQADPQFIVAGPDGNLYFTDQYGHIGQVYPWGYITEFATPIVNGLSLSTPYGITAGPDGNIWYTDPTDNVIGRMSIATNQFALYYPPTANCYPAGIASGPDGNLWFAEGRASKIGRLTPSGTITEFSLSSSPWGVVAGPDGNVWFTTAANSIGRITPTGTATYFSIPTSNAQPQFLTVGADGNIWFTEYNVGKIGKVTTSGTFTEYTLPSSFSYPYDITPGNDGTVWFTEIGTNRIGSITAAGVVTEINGGSNPFGITVGSDGNLWVAEEFMKEIDRIVP